MNKTLFISILGTITLLVLGLWFYLIFNGTPESTSDIFTNFSLGGNSPERPAVITEKPNDPSTVVDTSSHTLNQLTTKSVAGYVAINSTSSSMVRYAERGTGYIFDIDLGTGQEERRSGTTFTRITQATFSPSGNWVLLQSDTDTELVYLTASSTYGTAETITEKVENVSFTDTALYYTVRTSDSTVGIRRDLVSGAQTEIFSTPLTEIDVVWSGDSAYFFNRPSALMRGSVYRLSGSTHSLLFGPEYGLFATQLTAATWLVSTIDTEKQTYQTIVLDEANNSQQLIAIMGLPGKCDYSENHGLWCLGSLDLEPRPDAVHDWFVGAADSSDLIWSVDMETGEATLSEDPYETLGYTLDGQAATIKGTRFFFINRTNSSLWSYDLE